MKFKKKEFNASKNTETVLQYVTSDHSVISVIAYNDCVNLVIDSWLLDREELRELAILLLQIAGELQRDPLKDASKGEEK